MPAEKRAVLIAGPTASGKSALARDLTEKRGGSIINADSMQVYRELRILTARPTPEEEVVIPHRLYGCVSGAESWSVAAWLNLARREIEAAWQGGSVPILVGGTGLYFKALEQGLADIPPIPKPIREKWRTASGDLHDELRRRDPESALRLEPGDRQRIIRALEVVEGTGMPLKHWQKGAAAQPVLAEATVERFLMLPDRGALYRRAEARFEAMVAQGAIEEVRGLLQLAIPPTQPIMKAIGVRELSEYLAGVRSLDEAVNLAKTATRQYIKRQLTWWRNQSDAWHNMST